MFYLISSITKVRRDNVWFLKQQSFNSFYSQPHNADKQTHHKTTCCTLTSSNLLQTVPQAAPTKFQRLKIYIRRYVYLAEV